jgi:hypothetical protein
MVVVVVVMAGQVVIKDADTIQVFGRDPDARLVGFNAPETLAL